MFFLVLLHIFETYRKITSLIITINGIEFLLHCRFCQQIDAANKDLEADLEILKDRKSIEKSSILKDVWYYYMILVLYKHRLFNRLYTHRLESLLDDCWANLPDSKTRTQVEELYSELSRYHLTPELPGICIIFGMVQGRREGAEVDIKNVQDVFKNNFKFNVIVKQDPTSSDVYDVIEKLGAGINSHYDRSGFKISMKLIYILRQKANFA